MPAATLPREINSIDDLDFSRRYSYADYLTWRFMDRVELIRGWIARMSPAPSRRHQEYAYGFTAQLVPYFKERTCKPYFAPFDVRLPDSRKSRADKTIFTVVQPDLCVICDPEKLDDRGCIGAPDWIIEILSPGNTKKETDLKFSLYEEAGVREYWIVGAGDQTVTVFDLRDGRYQFRKIYSNEDIAPVGIFAGLEINLTEVFAD